MILNPTQSPLVLRTPTTPKYVVVGVTFPNKSVTTLLSVEGKIVVFDTLAICQEWLPQLGGGRFEQWSKDRETLRFKPYDPSGVSKAQILTGYDPHHLPPGMPMSANGERIRSETPGKPWQHHIMWNYAFFDCGQMQKQADGSFLNLAIGAPQRDYKAMYETVPGDPEDA